MDQARPHDRPFPAESSLALRSANTTESPGLWPKSGVPGDGWLLRARVAGAEFRPYLVLALDLGAAKAGRGEARPRLHPPDKDLHVGPRG